MSLKVTALTGFGVSPSSAPAAASLYVTQSYAMAFQRELGDVRVTQSYGMAFQRELGDVRVTQSYAMAFVTE